MEVRLKDQGIALKPFDLHLEGRRGGMGLVPAGSAALLVIKAITFYEGTRSVQICSSTSSGLGAKRDNGSMGDLSSA